MNTQNDLTIFDPLYYNVIKNQLGEKGNEKYRYKPLVYTSFGSRRIAIIKFGGFLLLGVITLFLFASMPSDFFRNFVLFATIVGIIVSAYQLRKASIMVPSEHRFLYVIQNQIGIGKTKVLTIDEQRRLDSLRQEALIAELEGSAIELNKIQIENIEKVDLHTKSRIDNMWEISRMEIFANGKQFSVDIDDIVLNWKIIGVNNNYFVFEAITNLFTSKTGRRINAKIAV